MTCREETVKVRGRNVRLYRGGAGPSLLFLHDSFCPSWLPLHELLAAHCEVLVPIHPGFSGSEDDFDQFEEMDDLLFHYLDLCEALRLDRPALAGASFGGWIAAEWAIRYGHSLKSLVLIDALGLRLTDAPAADILSLDPGAMRQAMFGDPASALALETIPNTPKAEAMESTILARPRAGALCVAVSRQSEVAALPASHSATDVDPLGRARRHCDLGARQGLPRGHREI